jgi:hypothetical protein
MSVAAPSPFPQQHMLQQSGEPLAVLMQSTHPRGHPIICWSTCITALFNRLEKVQGACMPSPQHTMAHAAIDQTATTYTPDTGCDSSHISEIKQSVHNMNNHSASDRVAVITWIINHAAIGPRPAS